MTIEWVTYPDGTPILRWKVLRANGPSEIQDHRGRPVVRVPAWRKPNEDGIDRRAGIIGIGLQLLKRDLAEYGR